MALLPDLSADSVVILIGKEPPLNPYILPSSWSDTWVFPYLFHDARGRAPELVANATALGFDESLVRGKAGSGGAGRCRDS